MGKYEKEIADIENELTIYNYVISILVLGRHEYGMLEARADVLKMQALKALYGIVETKETYLEILMRKEKENE